MKTTRFAQESAAQAQAEAKDKQQHTPGPLVATEMRDGDWEISKDGDVLATVHGDDNDPLCWPAGANAKLFAAAPELLETLQVIVSNTGLSYHGIKDLARAAIAKAIGK